MFISNFLLIKKKKEEEKPTLSTYKYIFLQFKLACFCQQRLQMAKAVTKQRGASADMNVT